MHVVKKDVFLFSRNCSRLWLMVRLKFMGASTECTDDDGFSEQQDGEDVVAVCKNITSQAPRKVPWRQIVAVLPPSLSPNGRRGPHGGGGAGNLRSH